MQFRPSGKLGALLDKIITVEVNYMGEFDADGWRARGTAAFMKMHPRLDVFPTREVTTGDGGFGTIVVPGEKHYEKFNAFLFSFGGDYTVLEEEDFTPYIGVDLVAGFTGIAYTNSIPLVRDEHYTGGSVILALRGRAGAQYRFLSSFSVFAEISRMYGYMEESDFFSSNDIGAGVCYYF